MTEVPHVILPEQVQNVLECIVGIPLVEVQGIVKRAPRVEVQIVDKQVRKPEIQYSGSDFHARSFNALGVSDS